MQPATVLSPQNSALCPFSLPGCVTATRTLSQPNIIHRHFAELSSLLMSHGEYEVYTFTREAFEKSAKMLEPKAGSIFDRPAPAFGGGAGGGAGTAAAKGASMFDDDDMFSEEDKAKKPSAVGTGAAAPAGSGAAGATQRRVMLLGFSDLAHSAQADLAVGSLLRLQRLRRRQARRQTLQPGRSRI